MLNRSKPLVVVLFLFALGTGGVLSGMFMTTTVLAVTKDRYQDLQLFTKVLNIIEQHYVEEVDTKKLIYGGVKGMLSSLDPHTNFLPPDIFKEFREETSGEFGGIGIEIGMQDDILTVVSPIEDTPAWKAGIKAGDRIVEIEGKSTKGLSLVEAVSKMRGKKGSDATMTIWREGFDKPRKMTITRENIKVRSIKYTDLEDGYAYVRVTSFIERTGSDLHDALEKHEKKSGTLKGLVIDLRNNPGGLLDQAVAVADEFMDEGPIVSTIGRNKAEKVVEYAKKEGTRAGFPVVVLVNEYSASASEIVAGALQDSHRAVIMGNRSFGKGSVQSVVDLGDGAGLKITVARYYTPSGRSIQGLGITPDVVLDNIDNDAFQKAIIQRRTLRESDIEGHLIGESEKVDEKKSSSSDNDDDQPFYMAKKKKEETPEEKESRERKEDAKLSPKERLLKRDYQAGQAFNYVKSFGVFKKFLAPEAGAAPVKPQETPQPVVKEPTAKAKSPEVLVPKKKVIKPAVSSTPAPGASAAPKPVGSPVPAATLPPKKVQ